MTRLMTALLALAMSAGALIAEAPATQPDRLDALEARVNRLEQQNHQLRAKLAEVEKQLDELASAKAAASDQPTEASSSAPALRISEADVQKHIAEVVPQLEKIWGQKFTKLPKVVVGSKKATIRAMAEDMVVQIRADHPELPESQARQAAYKQATQMVNQTLGKYGVKEEILTLLPGNLMGVLRRHKIDPKHADDIFKILIAHELTHALQAEVVDVIDTLAAQKDRDTLSAYGAVVEGQCMFSQDRVAKSLKLDEANDLYNKTFLLSDLPAYAMLPPAVIRQEFTYVTGQRFIEAIYEKSGPEAVWALLQKPPATTRMVAHPERYQPGPSNEPDLTIALQPFASHFERRDGGPWTIRVMNFPELAMRMRFGKGGTAALDELTGPILSGAMASAGSKTGAVNMRLYRLDSPESVEPFFDRLEKLSNKGIDQAEHSKHYDVKTYSIDQMPGLKGMNRRYHVELVDKRKKRTMEKWTVRQGRGPNVIEMSWSGGNLSDEEVQRLFTVVYDVLEMIE
jgi:hypothetical protein